jgi:phytoene synthase
MTQLFGLSDPDLLERAHALGHGMQLTNIARDVGEDWARGRVYLPGRLLDEHGITLDDLGAMARQEVPPSEAYRDAMRALLARADAYYASAWPGVRVLPPFFRRPVAAAAAAYRGIHREIVRNDFDNLSRRAFTSTPRKLVLAWSGLLDSARSA